jgi:putative ABC transport system permease protein
VWRNSLRDLQWRRRRFVVAVAGTALVFAMTLLLAGLSNAFRAEAHDTVDATFANTWVVRDGGAGPFTSFRLFPTQETGRIAALPGVESAGPVVFLRATVTTDEVVDANILGHDLGGIGSPPVARGRSAETPREAVVDASLGIEPGGSVTFEDRPFLVVGVTEGLTLFAGAPNVYLSLDSVQELVLDGRPLASAVGVRGTPSGLPQGFRVVTAAEAVSDALRPVLKGIQTIDFTRSMLWAVAAFIVGAVVYLSALERTRDFAVFKATGVSTAYVYGGLAGQAVIVSVGAAVLGAGLSWALEPLFPMRLVVPRMAFPILGGMSVGVGLVASLFGVRRAATVDPALAFGGP